MAKVIFSSELQKLTGEKHTNVTATVYRDIIEQLVERYELLDRDKLLQMAVAIDGVIIHAPLLEVVQDASEVHLLFRISGG